MVDLNTVDSLNNLIRLPVGTSKTDNQELEAVERVITRQYEELENLGVDYLLTLENRFKPTILNNLVLYVDDNYTAVADLHNITGSEQRLLQMGEMIYYFICVDSYNIIIPNFILKIGCTSIEQFDTLFRTRFNSDYSLVKASLLKTVKEIADRLINLKNLDRTAASDINYQNLVNKFTYYLELIDFGNTERLVNKFLRPILTKHFSDLLWRTI